MNNLKLFPFMEKKFNGDMHVTESGFYNVNIAYFNDGIKNFPDTHGYGILFSFITYQAGCIFYKPDGRNELWIKTIYGNDYRPWEKITTT